jgi:hypothetical protein
MEKQVEFEGSTGMLGITLKSAWFMSHRIREAMREGDLAPFGSNGGVVEVDETYIGRDKTIKPDKVKRERGFHHKHKVLSLVDRTTGQARSFVVDDVKASTLAPIVRENLAREAKLMTDENYAYIKVGREFSGHDFVHARVESLWVSAAHSPFPGAFQGFTEI